MTILGIDPGYGIIGYGLVKYDGRQFTPVQFGAIRTEIGAPMPQRLCELYNDLNTLLETFHPEEAAVEELFFNQNITTGIQVAQARGVILLALAQRGLRPASYTPSQVKMSVVGYGKAEKRQVMEMTRTLLGLKKVPHPDDAADALALAICHGHSLRADALR
ncbi:MAG: crossover junction endodeoxyribonuclease RuvC [Clostridiaceae bacterium]|nr:crossover junction endodeoxyribonuclease RuvC [Clostridiaceae bacterium]MCI9484014.1 crossover junction endodeoxyribonuclease RuvC [Clostridiaceae bacterium]MDE7034866.1 crossover junction endodeoxyribonuclease RuvC [Eubacteriales bacterium]NBH80296.1 crossover junction endodeoxyribonuclease RuvC [Clostridiaceae bacterium]NBI83072.1 crossover junction endodeoxyribonuclease RuvC [Clostridiaceae bacterium]